MVNQFLCVFDFVRYQLEQPCLVYDMAGSQEEVGLSDGISVPSIGMLPGMEERFSFRTLLFPDNPEPSTLSGFIVNICTSVMGR